MKKIAIIFLLLTSLLKSYAVCVDGIYYIFDYNALTARVSYDNNKFMSMQASYSGSINVPERITYQGKTYVVNGIYQYAFAFCYDLTSIKLPQTITSIEKYCFQSCTSLVSLKFPDSVESIEEGACKGCTSLVMITIGESVKSIADYAFEDCSSLERINFPNSIKTIGENVFTGCNKLSSPIYNSDLFAYMPKTTDGAYNIPDGIQIICDYAFQGCKNLTQINIPNSVFEVGTFAFQNCYSLKSIIIPEGVEILGNSTFKGCHSLESVQLPKSLKTINLAFIDCGKLTEITIPEKVEKIYQAGWTLNKVTINSNIMASALPEGAGKTYGEKLQEVVFGDKVKRIGSAVSRNYQLQKVVIGDSVETIGGGAFTECHSISSVVFPKTNCLKSIGAGVFHNCSTLTIIDIPQSVDTISQMAFSHCGKLRTISLPKNLKYLGEQCFEYCTSLDSIRIPNSVKVISKNMFNQCKNLSYVTLCKNITSIGLYAFNNCINLRSIIIPNRVDTIESYAFGDCEILEEMIIGSSVKSIGDCAFKGCHNLKKITLYSEIPPEISELTFFGLEEEKITLYVPKNSLQIYQNDSNWNIFNIRTIVAEVTTIDSNEPIISPSNNEVTITWPIIEETDTYTLTITENGDTICVQTFNANGQLTNIAFAAPSHNGAHQAPVATLTAHGYRFMVTGLEYATKYNYYISAYNSAQEELCHFEGAFSTKGLLYQVNTIADDGIVIGGGNYDYGAKVELTAIPNEHYHFVQWSDGVKDNPRTIMVVGDTAYSALFAIDHFIISVVAENGTVTGVGTYDYGTEVTLTAIPNEGYEFVDWSNGVTDNPYSFIVEKDVDLTANFKKVDTGWQDIRSGVKATKYFHNGNLIIERNGIKYTATGQKVR